LDLPSSRALAEQCQDSFRRGLAAFDRPEEARAYFRAAAGDYRQLAEQGFHSADLYLNMGNAEFLAGDLPRALIAYRHGLQQDPLNGGLWDNLEAARDQVGYPGGLLRHRPAGDELPIWLPRPGPDFVLQSALVLYGLGWCAVWIRLIWRPKKIRAVAMLLFCLAGGAAALWVHLDHRIARDREYPPVVVAVNSATLRRGNGNLYPRHPDLPLVNRGMEAVLLYERGGWLQVQFPGGEVGWLPKTAVIDD
jgi:tetratricopeptide (TPR) repeat protein